MISPVCCMCLVLALISAQGIKAVIVCAKQSVHVCVCVAVMRMVGHPQGLCFYSEQRRSDLFAQGHTVHPISIKHPRVTPSWSSLLQEMMQALLNYIGCETNKMGPILVKASDKNWLLDALQQLLQACAPRLWNWEMIICEAQQSTTASSTITQHVHLAMSALHEERI